MADNDAPKESVPDEHEFKLQLFKSPVVPGALGHVQSRPSAGPDQNGVPQLVRHNEAINLEVFYDLFLAVSPNNCPRLNCVNANHEYRP